MLKKIIIGVLLVTVIVAGGTALAYNIAAQEPTPVSAAPDPLVNGGGYVAEQPGGQQGETGGTSERGRVPQAPADRKYHPVANNDPRSVRGTGRA